MTTGHLSDLKPGANSGAVTESAPVRFVGRQPILDADLKLYGHELLFRSGDTNEFSGDNEQATRSVIDNALLLIPEDCSEISFINCTRMALISGIVTLLPAETTVLEILEHVEPDPELLECCKELKKAGYKFALDDFAAEESKHPFLEIADYIKVDFLASDAIARRAIYDMAAGTNVKFIAEKVETELDVETAWAEGCTLFQGYFFCRPMMIATRAIPQNQLVYLRLLAELNREPINLLELEQLVMADTSICYRLLRLVNSALYALPSPVSSIRSALMMIGESDFRKVVTVALANVAATAQSRAASRVALERAKFCELIAPTMHVSPSTLYLLGMLSLIDVILTMPMHQVMTLLPLDSAIKSALLGEESSLTVAVDLVRSRELGDWKQVEIIQKRIGLDESAASLFYFEALQWADKINRLV